MRSTLLLVRHGIAEDPGPGRKDADRALTEEGERKMRRTALGLAHLGIRPTAILASPLVRAQQTAECLREVLAESDPIETLVELAPGHDPREVLHALHPYRDSPELILVGHLPDIGQLASYLLSGSPHAVPIDFRKGAVAAIEVARIPPTAPGILRWFMTSKQLRSIARPN